MRVGIVIVGDEILSAKVVDENGPYLLRELRGLGAAVPRLLVVGDRVEEIAWAVEACLSCDAVLTAGGVGPTHDDVTPAGVARALGRPLARHPEMERILRGHYGAALTDELLRMADLPQGARLLLEPGLWYPAVTAGPVYLLPGVPSFLRRKFELLRERFRGRPVHCRVVYFSVGEGILAAHLDRLVAAFPAVRVGSYPRIGAPDHQVYVTLEAEDPSAVDRAVDALVASVPGEALVRVE